MKKRLLMFVLFVTTMIVAQATEKRAVDYQSTTDATFSARSVSGIRSMKDGLHYSAITPDRMAIVRYNYQDGAAVDTIINLRHMKSQARISSYTLSQDENLVMLPMAIEVIYRHSYSAEHWIYDRTERRYYPLSKNGKQQVPSFSPDARHAAFVRDNNLFVVDLMSGVEKAITIDGHRGSVINGLSDWVYEEEFGFDKAYEWSPASDAVAYYRFDESKVKSYPMPTYNKKIYPENVVFKYPKAGEVNSTVQIRVYNIASGSQALVDVGNQTDQYIPLIEWTGRDGELALHRTNRKQNEYDMLLVNAANGVSREVYSEASNRYVNHINKNKMHFLPTQSLFIVENENDGFNHLYLYDMNGKMLRQLTKGEFEVTEFNAIDTKNKVIYYTATDTPLNRALYWVKYGKGGASKPVRMSDQAKGTYNAAFSNGAKYYIEYFSSVDTPTRVSIYNSKGSKIRTIEDNVALKDTVAKYDMPRKEFFTFKIPTGEMLHGYILKPSDFDSTKNYPLFMTQYSGPGSQSVANRWGVGWEAALVKDGYLVACVDGRGTGFRGQEFRSCTYGDLGRKELEDQVAAAKYLGSLPYIDAARIGIYGWSYGGFMALNAILQAGDVFKLAVAVAPVTSWRYYDTIYTELYNGLPSENAKGYDSNAPLTYADGLKGKLLLAHGTADDNVHIQNSFDMISALLDKGKDFEALIYPDQNHGMGEDRHHLMRRAIKFINENL